MRDRPSARPKVASTRARHPAKPPAFLVTSQADENVSRLRAERERAERILRKTGNPWAALAELGITTQGGKPGRRGISPRQLDRLAELYVNMMTWPKPGEPPQRLSYARTDRLDLLFETSAAMIAAQRNGEPLPPTPDELVYIADCDAPMSREDALRNVAAYQGVGCRQAWELLRRSGRELDLPPRPPR